MSQSFGEFLNHFKKELHHLFHEEEDINQLSLKRGLPDHVWKKIMSLNPLSVAVPEEFGGRGVKPVECLGILSAASYEALALSLTFGINLALFMEPLAKYGNKELQNSIFKRFMQESAMGGLMITEPEYGSDALNMQTFYEANGNGYHIKGQKHWQGLTGMADFWLIAARKKNEDGKLARDIEFFIADHTKEGQKVHVDHYYNNSGLYMIPYGLNILDLQVPADQKLEFKGSGIKMMLDILHRSRLQFPGMGMGFIQRLLDESLQYTRNRMVGGQSLNALDSVKFQLSRIQAAYSIASGMCAQSARVSAITYDLSGEGLQANSMKALLTDLMQESAQICTQLAGSAGYKMEHFGGRGIMDCRPFQIFEGPNEMLYTQIAQMLLKQMKKSKTPNLYEYLKSYEHTALVAPRFKDLLNFDASGISAQRQQVVLGEITARLVSLQYVFYLVEKGFRKDLFENAYQHMAMDIRKRVTRIQSINEAQPIEDYEESSVWSDFI